MSNNQNDKLREQFHDLLEDEWLCPFCMDIYKGDDWRGCCGEVNHEEKGYCLPGGDWFLESEYEEYFQQWLKNRGD